MSSLHNISDAQKKSNLLVTGGTGFLGKNILYELLDQGFEKISALYRNEHNIPLDLREKVKWIQCDILDVMDVFDCVMGQNIVIHAAAEVSFSLKNRKTLIATSKEGTSNLVNAALEAKVEKFVFVSSVAAIGRQKAIENIDELKVFSHSTFDTSYGLAKFLAEQEVWRAHAEGLSIAIVNPSLILGFSSFDRSSNQLFDKIYKDKMPFYPVGSTGWVDMRDVVKAILRCIDKDIDGQRFIISAENHRYQDIFEKMSHQFQKPLKSRPLNPFWKFLILKIEIIKSILTGSQPLLTHETAMSMSANSIYDNKKSTEVLGIEYHRIDNTIKEGCAKYIAQID